MHAPFAQLVPQPLGRLALCLAAQPEPLLRIAQPADLPPDSVQPHVERPARALAGKCALGGGRERGERLVDLAEGKGRTATEAD